MVPPYRKRKSCPNSKVSLAAILTSLMIRHPSILTPFAELRLDDFAASHWKVPRSSHCTYHVKQSRTEEDNQDFESGHLFARRSAK